MVSPTVAETVSLPSAARRLGVSWPVAWRKLLRGELEGRQINGRWQVTASSVQRLQDEHHRQPEA